jgi:hypothetical protein
MDLIPMLLHNLDFDFSGRWPLRADNLLQVDHQKNMVSFDDFFALLNPEFTSSGGERKVCLFSSARAIVLNACTLSPLMRASS